MSELRRSNQKSRLKLQSVLQSMNLTIDAQATSTSGRWKILLGAHTKNGLPCYDVLAIRVTDFAIDAHHFATDSPENEGANYEESKAQAYKAARRFYEDLVVQMQARSQGEESDELPSMEIISPDGTKSDYTIN